MGKIKNYFITMTNNLKITLFRFPIVLIFIVLITVTISILIEGSNIENEEIYIRLIFTGIFGAFLSTSVQFLVERFNYMYKYRWVIRGIAFIIAALYYFLFTDNQMSETMLIHLLVLIFALFSIYLYLPSSKNSVDFSKTALVHFKSAFTAILYSCVIFLGLIAIYAAIDLLLFELDENIYAHTANIVFVFFLPVYYLSLLPKFNSKEEHDIKRNVIVSTYPRVLDILVSYIMIPLISIFSAVLIIYFIKILVTGVWPVGQVGPMVLVYSAVSLVIYILAYSLENRFTSIYKKLLPIVLIPLVIMQLVSSYIRIDAYGITESRYYVVLFGIYSIVCSVYLIFSKKKNTNMIVLLSALFAVLSIIPPIDAFSVSSKSQQGRIESILVKNDMLMDNRIIHKSNISNEDKRELTNITNYMARMGHIRRLQWMPEKYYNLEDYYGNFEEIYGFPPNYSSSPNDDTPTYVYAGIETDKPVDISGYDTFLKFGFYNNRTEKIKINEFTIKNKEFILEHENDEKGNIKFILTDITENKIIEIPLSEFADKIFEITNINKSVLPQKDLTLLYNNENISIEILFEYINLRKNKDKVSIGGDCIMFISVK